MWRMLVPAQRVWCLALILLATSSSRADDEIFSGLQVGEAFSPFTIRTTLGEQAGQELKVLEKVGDKPVVLIFVHEVNRPSVGLVRTLGDYLATRHKDGLTSAVVFLSDDATETENWMKRAQQAMPKKIPLGISVDGKEGPGAYGLNRNVTLTILVGKANKVTANFALVQPSLQADAPRIAQAIADVMGDEKAATLAELTAASGGRMERPAPRPAAADNSDLRPLLQPLIQKTASGDDVRQAAAAIEERMEKDADVRRRIGQIAQTIVRSGKLENYGTPAAQVYLKQWAEKFGPPDQQPATDAKPEAKPERKAESKTDKPPR